MQAALVTDNNLRNSSVEAYSLTPPRMQTETERLLSVHPPKGEGRFVAYRIRGTSEFSDIARSVETEVFRRFFGNSPNDLLASYGPYDAYSQFLLVIDRETQQPAGTLRVIENSHLGLKSLNDIREAPLELSAQSVLDYHGIGDLNGCWDVGTLAVRKAYRGEDHVVGTMLYSLFIDSAMAAGIQHMVCILDGHAYRQLTDMLAMPFETIAGTHPFEYLGAKGTRACYVRVPNIRPSVAKHMERLERSEPQKLAALRSCLTRVISTEGLPPVVNVG